MQEPLFFLVILIFSIILHEIAHGYVAEMLGDKTARLAGRLTLNPVPHIDPLGSIILPALMILGSKVSGFPFVFGWAKPVPYNPNNLSNYKWGTIAVGIAGVAVNLLIATIFGLMVRFSSELGITSESFLSMLSLIVYVNILLAVFNLIPFPPLDGAKVLFALLPSRFQYIHDQMEGNWLYFVGFIAFILFFGQGLLFSSISFVFMVITGMSL